MLTDLNWPSLQSRRRIYHLGMFYKIYRGHVNISLPYDLTSIPAYGCTRASQDFKIRLLSSSVDVYKRSFYERSIPAWNALSADVVSPAYYPEFIQIVACIASISNRVIARKLEQKQKKGWRGRGRGEEETLARKPHNSGKRPLIFHGSVHL